MPSSPINVQVGRVVRLNYGAGKSVMGRLAVIVDIIDHKRAVVEGPLSGVTRRVVRFRYMDLTRQFIKIQPNCSTKQIKAGFVKNEVQEKYDATPRAIKLAQREIKDNLTDFQRYQAIQLKKEVRKVRNTVLRSAKVAAK